MSKYISCRRDDQNISINILTLPLQDMARSKKREEKVKALKLPFWKKHSIGDHFKRRGIVMEDLDTGANVSDTQKESPTEKTTVDTSTSVELSTGCNADRVVDDYVSASGEGSPSFGSKMAAVLEYLDASVSIDGQIQEDVDSQPVEENEVLAGEESEYSAVDELSGSGKNHLPQVLKSKCFAYHIKIILFLLTHCNHLFDMMKHT